MHAKMGASKMGTVKTAKPSMGSASKRADGVAVRGKTKGTMLAGGGIKGGQVYGRTDENAFHVEDDAVSIEDFNSTIAHAVGIPHNKEIHSPDGRPFTLGNGGIPIERLF